MEQKNPTDAKEQLFQTRLDALNLPFIKENFEPLAASAAAKALSHVGYLEELIEGEALLKHDRGTKRRIFQARFPILKTLDQFNWSWPTSINRLQIQNLFRLQFLEENTNVILIGNTGLGKTHLSIALAYTACLQGRSALFTTALDAVNNLIAAAKAGNRKHELQKYLRPDILCLDELGYLALDKTAADLLFQIISRRYEHASTIISTNVSFKKWADILNGDAILASALLDRLLHHSETVRITGKSYRTRDEIE